MKSLPVEYDFKTTKIKLFKHGMLKDKYKCLPYMITLPLSQPLNTIPDPNPADPANKQTIINANNTYQGWLNFTAIQNIQPNIISIIDNALYFNKYSYNYRITVDVVSKGDTTTPLRFMAQNPFSLLASNMNDVYGNETVFNNLYNGQKIIFTITGEYQFFYIYYLTTNFNLNITINIDYKNYPVLVCDNKNNCQCGIKSEKNNEKCTCFVKNGNAYLKVKKDCNDIIVPVYTTRVIGNTVNKYLYPEFAYLRDLFYNSTLNNSLTTPDNLTNNIQLNSNVLTTTVLEAEFSGNDFNNCYNYLWCFYQLLSGNMVEITSKIGCPLSQIRESQPAKKYRYSWPETPNVTSVSSSGRYTTFVAYYWWAGAWYAANRNINNKVDQNGTLLAGYYDNLSGYEWIAFGLEYAAVPSDTITPVAGTKFNITINEIL
jgi:hypothetical protein